MTRHKNFKVKDDQMIERDWSSEVQLSDEYAAYHKQFLVVLSEF